MEEVQRQVVEVQAMLKYHTLLALDPCTMLGGIESPAWPSQPRAMGMIFDGTDTNAPISVSKLSYDAVSHALTLEWWGIQHWRVYRGSS